jgi:hypothetical protein
VGSLLGSAAPHISAPPLQASAPSVSASNPRTRSLKNYLPAARSNAKSLPSLAATLPLSFSASTSAASSPFPPLGQQQPFSAPLATLSLPPHFLSAPLRPGLAPPHSSGLLGSMHHTDGGPFPLVRHQPSHSCCACPPIVALFFFFRLDCQAHTRPSTPMGSNPSHTHQGRTKVSEPFAKAA